MPAGDKFAGAKASHVRHLGHFPDVTVFHETLDLTLQRRGIGSVERQLEVEAEIVSALLKNVYQFLALLPADNFPGSNKELKQWDE